VREGNEVRREKFKFENKMGHRLRENEAI